MSLSKTTRLNLADRAVSVALTDRYEELLSIAVNLHLLANRHSGERFDDSCPDQERARRGYRAELAVAQHYGLTPEIDYRPSGTGDFGRDFWARTDDGTTVAIDVKSTQTSPPRLYLTQKRAWSDQYTLPDAYLLASSSLTEDNRVHLLGWCSADTAKQGQSAESYGNPVWITPLTSLDHPPKQDELRPVTENTKLCLDASRIGCE